MAVQMTLKYEPLLNADIERDRLKLAMQCCMVTPNVRLARHRSDGEPYAHCNRRRLDHSL